MASRVKVLFYAINGTGLGHLSRLLAVARPMRELLLALDHLPDLRFVTTSEGSAAAHDFPVYKLPSKTVAGALPQAEFAASSKLLISNLAAQFSPHLLVNDTLAEGSFGEIAFLLSYAAASVFIDRHKDAAITASEVYRRHVTLYTRVLVPDYPEAAERYPAPRQTRREFVGPIHGYNPADAVTRQEARRVFGVREEQRLIYLSGGGGSDSREGLHHLAQALSSDPRNFLLVGYGPLHRGEALYRANVIPLFTADSRRWFPALDAAISAAGYNSYEELLAARVPTLFYAQSKGMDRQDERISLGLQQGWHGALGAEPSALSHDDIRERLEAILTGPQRVGILRGLAARPVSHGALRAAVEILALAPQVERARLYEAALHYQSRGACEYVSAHQALSQWWDSICTAGQRASLKEQAVLDWLRPQGQGHWLELDRFAGALATLDPRCRRELLKAWAHHGGEEAEQRVALADALQVLREHQGLGHVPAFLDSHKRPAQKPELLRLVSLLESDSQGEALAQLVAAGRRKGETV